MKQIHVIVRGRVQGVFYRNHVRNSAENLGITGTVKNLSDGTVEIVAQGEKEPLEEFLKKCKKGSMMAFVEKLDIQDQEISEEFEEFQIRH